MLSYRKIEDYISFIESLFNNQWVTVLYSNSDEFIKVRGAKLERCSLEEADFAVERDCWYLVNWEVKRVSSVYFNPELDAMSVMRFMNPEEVRGWELPELREELAKLLE